MPDISVRGWRLSLTRHTQAEDLRPNGQDKEAPKGQAPGGVDTAADATELAKANEAMRSHLQRMGAALAAAATAIIGGLGWTKVHDIFPIPRNVDWWTRVLLIAAIICAPLASAWLATIFFVAQRRIRIGTTDESRKGLHGKDTKIATRVLQQHAREESAPDLLDVELRAMRFDRIARSLSGSGDDRAKRFQDEADRLYQFVRTALHRAASAVLEDRTRRAFLYWPTIAALVLATGGIFSIFAIADYYKGERELSDLRVKCAKNEKDFPNACAPFEKSADRSTRQLLQQAQHAANEVNKAKTVKPPATLSPAQKKLLAAAAACDKAISKTLRAPARAEIVGLCATTTK
jgi:hypothetical protein